MRAGNLTQRCYTHFLQQEALYLTGVSSTLELRVLMAGEMMGVGVKESRVLQQWREDTQRRLRKLMEERQGHMDTFKAINIFREQMMNQKSFYKALACDEEEKNR
ncbi:hypothetical protein F7725_004959 [Dissostichus mawsoni]|uniref:Uncharacterized protein n=1 Tax=Dissostichus mawsoni TaxID=36200 RepID=A0A7J5XK76_DISMA|nr:hypothetical protein F7725_004959 [Dissostichus mawsoni]